MSSKLLKWEISLLVGIVFGMLWGADAAKAQSELAQQVIRLHVVAHSDSAEDQALKLKVRDAVLTQVESVGRSAETTQEMEQMLRGKLETLEQAGEEVLRANGCPYAVTAELTQCWFPTKEYQSFAFPAGEYTALRVTIGAGEGQNWWCVAFPPLCVGASAQSVKDAVEVGYFTQEQSNLITKESGEYILRFKSIELLGAIKGLFLQDA